MKSKSTKKKKSGGGDGGAQQFLVWHGEKVVVGIVVVVALWFAMQGLGYQTLSWQPNALEEDANAAETAIRNSTRAAEDEEIEIFDFKEFAAQIRNPIPAEPYRFIALWDPTGSPFPQIPPRVSASAPTNVSANVSVDIPTDVSADIYVDIPVDIPADEPADVTVDTTTEE